MAPIIYVIKDEVVTVSMEAKCLGALRLTCGAGTRVVAVVNASEMIDFMVSEGGVVNGLAGPAQARAWWGSCTKERLAKYTEKGNLAMVATVGPGDLLYLPPCCLFAEQVQKQACFGFKVSVVPLFAQMQTRINKFLGYCKEAGASGQAELTLAASHLKI